MQDLWSYLKTANKPITLYGTGNGADKVLKRLSQDNVKVSGVFSSAGFKKNKMYAGHIISDYNSLKQKWGDMIILVCFGSHLPLVMDNVKALNNENELYIPDVPVAQNDIFDLEFAKKYKNELQQTYDILEDKLSKNVFENIIMFKLTGKLDYLLKAECDRKEVFDLLQLNKNENFLDLGAFTGDTVLEFIDYLNEYNCIIAVEPDNRNFKKLSENTKDLKDINRINAAVSDKSGVVLISKNHGRGNSADGKTVEVRALSLSDICKEFKPTYIKMDIEGNEKRAIRGGRDLLLAQRPKMHIACYHTAYDIFEIPLLVKSISPDYKVYMRHHACFPAWDINCIFI